MRVVFQHSTGFTLIEILVVLVLLALIASMLPQGLTALYARSNHQALVQQTVGAARQCAIVAQQQQRSVRLGSSDCPLPIEIEPEKMTWLHADGTASQMTEFEITDPSKKAIIIVIDRLTSNVSVATNAQTQ